MCETHIHCFFLVVAASSNCIFCRFRPWDVSRSRACIFVWVYCNWWLHFLYSLVSSLKVPHWYNSCYGYSVSALRRNSAPEIALTFCYLVCRLKWLSRGYSEIVNRNCTANLRNIKRNRQRTKFALKLYLKIIWTRTFFLESKKKVSRFFFLRSQKIFFFEVEIFSEMAFFKNIFFRMDFFDYFFFAQNFLGV